VSNIVVIGAGIVGLATAMQLQMDGHGITLVDPNEPASGCSYGNAGYLSLANIFPPSSTESLFKLPKMLADPLGPLVIRPSHVPRFLPWGAEAALATRANAFARNVEAMSRLILPAIEAYAPLLKAAGAQHLLARSGALIVARTEAGLLARGKRMPELRSYGVEVDRITAEAVFDLEPGLSREIVGAIHYPGAVHCLDPQGLGRYFADHLLRNGARHLRAGVLRMRPDGRGGWFLDTTGGVVAAEAVVVSAGYRSDEVLRGFGYRIPLEAERGYHLMLPAPEVTLNRVVSMAEAFFVATPMRHGLRLAGTAEFASRDAPMNERRATMMYDLARPYLPGLSKQGAQPWMGNRPSLPDGLPAIGQARGASNLFYCFGHNHNGLMQAAISGKIVADLVAGRKGAIDPAPYRLERFSLLPSRRKAPQRELVQ